MDYNLLILFVAGCLIKSGISTDSPYCWATCNLSNCGSISEEENSFVRCTWKPSSRYVTDYSMTLTAAADVVATSCNDNCNEKANCSREIGHCEVTFYKKNCTLIACQHDEIYGQVYRSGVISDEKHIRFKICEIVKPNRPNITVKVTKNGKNLNISDTAESCLGGNRIAYRLRCTIKEKPSQTCSEFWDDSKKYHLIPIVNGAEYNFTLQSTKGKIGSSSKVYSAPSTLQNYVTSPHSAVDESFTLTCGGKDANQITAAWQKSGKVDFFVLTLTNEESKKTVNSTRVWKISDHQNEFEKTFQIPNVSWREYALAITAHNKGGKSASEKRRISRSHCQNIRPFSCKVVKEESSCVNISWESDMTEELQIEVSSNGVKASKNHVNGRRQSWQKCNLQKCQKYKILISTDRGGNEYVLCTMNAQTADAEPYTPPTISLKDIGSKFVIFQADRNTESCKYSTTFWWKLGARDWLQSQLSQSIRVESLKPNTPYLLSVAMRKTSNNSTRTFQTSETAPGEPPRINRAVKSNGKILISWVEPKILNGNITQYQLHFNTSLVDAQEKRCTADAGVSSASRLCTFMGNIFSVTLLNFTDIKAVKIRACTGGNCSRWSSSLVKEDNKEVFSILMISLFIACGVLIILVALIGSMHRARKSLPTATRPRMHPSIQMEFDEELMEHRLENHRATSHRKAKVSRHSKLHNAQSNHLLENNF